MERTGIKLIRDWGWRLVSCRNEEHWAVGTSETWVKEREVNYGGFRDAQARGIEGNIPNKTD